jgi:hypothetical protein
VAGGTACFLRDDVVARQVVNWWREAECAVRANRLPRARRFLRWILVCCPGDEEAWLWLARLASSHRAKLAYLRQAHAFHPNSTRVQAVLRQARKEQLESAVGDLKHGHSLLRCLPDQRNISWGDMPYQDNGRGRGRVPGKGGNGRFPVPPNESAPRLSSVSVPSRGKAS